MSHSLDRVRRQAQLEASVRFLPQVQALLQLGRQERDTYKTTVAQARGTYRGLHASLKSARPVVKRTYNQAEKSRLGANELAARVLSAAPADSPFRVAFGLEDAGARTRFAESRAGALHELSDRGLEAASNRAYTINQAGTTRAANLGKIGQQLLGVAQQRGTFAQAAVNDLLDANRKDRTTRRGQDKTLQGTRLRLREQHRHNVQTENNAQNKPGPKRRTVASNDAFISRISSARGWIDKIRRLYPAKTPHEVRELLRSGGKIQTGFAESTTATGKTTQHPTFETVPSFGDDLVINAGYDLHSFGTLSAPNRAALHRRHVSVPHNWRRPVHGVQGPVNAAVNVVTHALSRGG